MAKKHIKRKIITAVLFTLLMAGLLVLLFSGDNKTIVEDIFNGNVSADKLLNDVQNLGWRGCIVFGVLSMLQVVLTFLPAEPVQVLSGISYGFWYGSLICLAGVILGNTLIYILYKVYGEKLSDYFQKKIEVDFDVLRTSKRITFLIFILYFLPAIPYGLICFFTASLNTKYPKYIILTTLGSIPSIFIGVGLGHLAINSSWILSVCLFVVLVVIIVLLYVFRNKVFAKVNEFAKKQFGYSHKTKVRKPQKALSNVVFVGMKSYLNSKIKCKMTRDVDKLDKPSIVLCNHGSFIDFLYFSMFLRKEEPHMVINRQYFYGKSLGNLLKKLGAIPKSMFTVDLENIKNCLQVIKNDGTLVICPEARLSTAGEFEDIQTSTLRFLQKMDVSIYVIKFGGDYLAMPKWAQKNGKRKMRKGAVVEAHLSQLFKAGETKAMAPEEFDKAITSALYYNEYDWLKARPEIHYKQKNLAEGLDNILYKCPKCHSEFELSTKGKNITCAHCGFTNTLSDRYEFSDDTFATIADWYNWQMEEMRKQTEKEDFELRDNVKLFHHDPTGKKQLRVAGQGECVLNKTGLTYTGIDNGEEIVKFFPIEKIYRILFGADEDFELYEGEEIWYFVPKDKRTCVKWYMASILLGQKDN